LKTLLTILPLLAMSLTGGAKAAEERDTLSIGLAIEPPGLDPTRGSSEAIGMVTYDNIYEGLERFRFNLVHIQRL